MRERWRPFQRYYFLEYSFTLDAIAFYTNGRFGNANRRETKALRRVYTAVYGTWGGTVITADAACLSRLWRGVEVDRGVVSPGLSGATTTTEHRCGGESGRKETGRDESF